MRRNRPDDPAPSKLFDDHPAPNNAPAAGVAPDVTPNAVGVTSVPDEVRELAARLPRSLRLGTSSWSFPGWTHLVYDRPVSETVLARDGLAAYAGHPLLRTVGIDRTYYRPIASHDFAAYAAAVPEDFRFLCKAHEWVTAPLRDPQGEAGVRRHQNRGRREANPNFLDAAYASEMVVAPFVAGLGAKAGPLVFQFSPLPPEIVRAPGAFADRLAEFLSNLPRGPLYAVELRNSALLTPEYAAALQSTQAVHCFNAHPAMAQPSVQAETVAPADGAALVVRWMLNRRFNYDGAKTAYEPFDRLVDEDVPSRNGIADLCRLALGAGRPAYVVINNKAEGSAPLSVRRLAEEIVAGR